MRTSTGVLRYYMKSHFMDRLSDDAIAALLDCDTRRPTPQSLIVIRTLGGAVARVPDGDSAFAHRHAQYNVSIDASWTDPATDETAIDWARSSWDAMAAHATGGVYVNFAGLSDEVDLSTVFGSNSAQLARVRAAYDPDGVFSVPADQH